MITVPVPEQNNAGQYGGFKATKPSVAATDDKAWRDVPFVALFFMDIIAVIAFMVLYGLPSLQKTAAVHSDSQSSNLTDVLLACGIFSVIGSILSFALLEVAVAFAKTIITFTFWVNIFLCFTVAGVAMVNANAVMAILFGIAGCLCLCYYGTVRARIPFAAANLHVAAQAVKVHRSAYVLAFGLMFAQMVWVAVWIIAVIGISIELQPEYPYPGGLAPGTVCFASSDCRSGQCRFTSSKSSVMTCQRLSSVTQMLAWIFMALSFFWITNVFKNLLHVTVAGTVATWWAVGEAAPQNSLRQSLHRASTYSFGSICLGSLLVAILETLELMCREVAKRGGVGAMLGECIIGCLRSLMEYYNRWAFVYVGMYGGSFMTSGKQAMDLFRSRGFTAILNDDLTSQALYFVSLSCGALCALLGLIYLEMDPQMDTNVSVLLPLLGFACGIAVSIIPLSVLDSAVATVFVCFAEDPHAFSRVHPELYGHMTATWHRIYPQIMTAWGPLPPSEQS